MRLASLLFVFMVAFGASCLAQTSSLADTKNWTQLQPYFNQRAIVYYDKLSSEKGWGKQYLQKEYTRGTLVMSNGDTLGPIRLRYNMEIAVLEIKLKGIQSAVESAFVRSFYVGSLGPFINKNQLDHLDEEGFLLEAYSGSNVGVFLEHTAKRFDPNSSDPYSQTRSLDFRIGKRVLLNQGTEWIELKKKKQLKALLTKEQMATIKEAELTDMATLVTIGKLLEE